MVVCIHHSVFINKLLLTQYLADEKVLDIVHLFDLHKITVSICQTYDWYVPVIRAELVCTATNGITDYMKKSKAIFSNQSIARNDMKWKKHIEKIARNIQNLEFYTRPSDSNLESMLVHLGYRDDGTPFITLWKDGLSEMAI